MQINPSALDPIWTYNGGSCAPVRVLDSGLVEDHPLQLADDVAVLAELIFGLDVDVGRVPALRDLWQEMPVGRVDLDHVIDAGVVRHLHLG